MIKHVCDQSDCPLYEVIKPYNASGNNYVACDPYGYRVNRMEKQIILDEKGIKIISPNIDCYLECLFCSYRKNIDVKSEIIANKAKCLLEEE